MRFLIQRVSEAKVEVEEKTIGEIGKGFLVFVGVSATDDEEAADRLVRKMLGLRIFEDADGKTNLSLAEVGGSLLIVSQFTLYANCKKGNRPSFTDAGGPEAAERLYEYVIGQCESSGYKVSCGSFGAEMKVSLTNDGPFTVWLDSETL